MMKTKFDGPLPAALMVPWLEDNAKFQEGIKARALRLADVSSLRAQLEKSIRMTEPCQPCRLGAVDAATINVPFGDQLSILLQVIRIDDDGTPSLGDPERVTGIDSYELHLAEMPMRIAAECRELAESKFPTIADTSYWSFLMEVNQASTRAKHSSLPALEGAVRKLIDDGAFLAMVHNPFVVPMSKVSQSETFVSGISDRQIMTQVLTPGEFMAPRKLTEGTKGRFGIEHRFRADERLVIEDLYERALGVVFYKPHPWTRAFRIEGHLEQMLDDEHVMPLFAAIKAATATARQVIEPWPQFMADYVAKRLSAVATLYGELNWHRYPDVNFLRARTR